MTTIADRYPKALVTGARTGLGRAFTDMLLREGVRVWGTARDPSRFPTRAGFSAVAMELGDRVAVDHAFRRAESEAGGLDLVVNSAGYGLFGPFAERDFDHWRAQCETMLIQTLQLSHLALQGMLARNRGALVNVSSLAVDFPLPFMSGYNAAKAALSAFSESLLVEVAGTGVIVLDFRPGDYSTGFNQAMHAESQSFTSAAGAGPTLRRHRAWFRLEAHLREAPPPERAAADLRRALRRGRSGMIRSGGFFQARLAPLLARFAPAALRHAVMARYFGSH